MQLVGRVEEPEVMKAHARLPIFRICAKGTGALYTPGWIVTGSDLDLARIESTLANQGDCTSVSRSIAAQLTFYSEQTISRWAAMASVEFLPEAMTIHLTDSCNLNCAYCYSRRSAVGNRATLKRGQLAAAASLVARSCASGGKRFTVALHGGGEPTLSWGELIGAVDLTRRAADAARVDWFGALSTNGTFDSDKSEWISRQFNQVSVSFDGPPDLQDSNRPLLRASPSSGAVERNIHLLLEYGGDVIVRTTVTHSSFERQSEIVDYIVRHLGVKRVNIEPVYRYGSHDSGIASPIAESFAQNFLQAEAEGKRIGCEVRTSCCRIEQIHGPYCDILRNTLLLAADGSAYPCTFCLGEQYRSAVKIGSLDKMTNTFLLDHDKISSFRQRAARSMRKCKECINAYHCARECPDECYIAGTRGQADFRCRVAKRLSVAWILQAARLAQSEQADGTVLGRDCSYWDGARGPLLRPIDKAEVKI